MRSQVPSSEAAAQAEVPRRSSWRAYAARAAAVDWPATLRPAFVLLQAASIVVTWQLWQGRESPPPLPVFEGLPRVDLGVVLLITLGLVLVKPFAGALCHLVVLLVACLLDQTRLQPEFISLALILLGTAPRPYARVVAKAHLVTLWLWAGLNKALSLGFMGGSARWLYNAFPVHLSWLEPKFGWLIICAETSIGILLLIPRLRRLGVLVAVGLHFSGLVALVSIRWNVSVWPWNVALALAALAFFFWPERYPAPRLPSVAIGVAFALMPLGFYAGVVDAYLAHNLYTSNTAVASICAPEGCSDAQFRATWREMNVPLPPEPRLYRDLFRRVCASGDELVVYPRQTRLTFGLNTTVSREGCPR